MAQVFLAEMANPGVRQGVEETEHFIISESKKALRDQQQDMSTSMKKPH